MSGVRESDRKKSSITKKQKEPITFDSVEGKYKKEKMTAKEFAMFLCKRKGLKPGEITDKTVKNYIAVICDISDGLIGINEFKKNPEKKKSKYEFKAEYHDMLLTLMASDYFDGRKNDRRLSTRAKLYSQLTTNIDAFLLESDKKAIKANPTYYNARLEEYLTTQLINELSSLLRNMYHSDPVLRYQVMIEVLYRMHSLCQWIKREDIKATSTRMIYADTLDSMYQKGIFEATDFDEFLVKYFALKMHGGRYDYILGGEELSEAAYCLATKLFNITVKDDTDIKRKIDEVDRKIENEPRFQELMSKAKQILNLEDPEEFCMYEDIKRIASIQYLRPFVSKEDYDCTVRFTENSIKQDKWDILNAFCQLGRRGISDDEIQKILDIKDRKNE